MGLNMLIMNELPFRESIKKSRFKGLFDVLFSKNGDKPNITNIFVIKSLAALTTSKAISIRTWIETQRHNNPQSIQ